jgi:hypothetical protein
VDGSGTVVNDQNGVPNSFTVSLPGLGTSFVAKTHVFRTPADLPTTLRLRLKLTTALSGGSNLFVDDVALAVMSSLYPQGPSVAVFAADTQTIRGDTWAIGITNNRTTTSRGWNLAFQRWYGMMGLGLLLPVSNSPTIADNLIQT